MADKFDLRYKRYEATKSWVSAGEDSLDPPATKLLLYKRIDNTYLNIDSCYTSDNQMFYFKEFPLEEKTCSYFACRKWTFLKKCTSASNDITIRGYGQEEPDEPGDDLPDEPEEPVHCAVCTSKKMEDMKITNLAYNKQVKIGDTYNVSCDITSLSYLISDKFKLNCQNLTNKTCAYQSGTTTLPKKATVHESFEGIMPEHDCVFRLSLWDDNMAPIPDECEDYRDFKIKIGETTMEPSEPSFLDTLPPYTLYIILGMAAIIIVLFLIWRSKRAK